MNELLTALRALAEPTRLRLFQLCARGDFTVGELGRILGQSQPRISRHLRLLTEAGLLERLQEGSWAFHRFAQDGKTAELAKRMRALLAADDGVIASDLGRLAAIKRERAAKAAAYFAKNAESWHRLRSLHVDDRDVERVIQELLPAEGVRVLLDIGTGTGRMLEIFGPRVDKAMGIDLSREMLAVARANLESANLVNCSVRQADLFQLPFAAAGVDAVTIHQVLHFVDDPAAAIVEAARVLSPGGRALIVDFAPHTVESLRAEHQHRRLGFADGEVSGWLGAAALKTKKIVHLPGSPLTVTVWLAAKTKAAPVKGSTATPSPQHRDQP